MTDTLLRSDSPVLIVGAGEVSGADINDGLTYAETIVAADGGAQTVLSHGHVPRLVIGDLDSLKRDPRLDGRVHRIAEQDTTDFDKALRSVDAPLVLAAGFTGGRMDHHLAAMNVLVRHAHRPCIVLGAETLVFLCPPILSLDLPIRSVLSLFPMAAVRMDSAGLRWPTAGIDFTPDGRIGTSNAVAGSVELRPDRPRMLVLLPNAALPEVVARLAGAETWPAPARVT